MAGRLNAEPAFLRRKENACPPTPPFHPRKISCFPLGEAQLGVINNRSLPRLLPFSFRGMGFGLFFKRFPFNKQERRFLLRASFLIQSRQSKNKHCVPPSRTSQTLPLLLNLIFFFSPARVVSERRMKSPPPDPEIVSLCFLFCLAISDGSPPKRSVFFPWLFPSFSFRPSRCSSASPITENIDFFFPLRNCDLLSPFFFTVSSFSKNRRRVSPSFQNERKATSHK